MAKTKTAATQDAITVPVGSIVITSVDTSTGQATVVFPEIQEEPGDPDFSITVTPTTTIAALQAILTGLQGM